MTSGKAPKDTSLQIQLETLQTRITVHGNRMWQLPFTYVSFAAISSSLVTDQNSLVDANLFFGLLSVAGLIVFWAMVDAYRSYSRTASAMNSVESKLGLEEHTTSSFSHAAPHFTLCLGAVVALGFAAKFL